MEYTKENMKPDAKHSKEILRWAREKYASAPESEKANWEYMFPELKESEDERIRKMLIEQMERWKKMAKDNNVEQDVKDASAAIAYLEKQKEQQSADVSEKIKELCSKYPLNKNVASKQELSAYHQGLAFGATKIAEYLGAHQPTEWSEEDEDMLNSIIATYQLAAQDSDSEQARHLLEMQERFLKSLRPQPKQEWSEEDEDELNNILAFVKNDIPISGDTRREFYNWLKSIKNRGNSPKSNTNSSYWKPSKEQISALEYFIRSWGESGTMSPQNPTLCAAKSLLNDLQKLL